MSSTYDRMEQRAKNAEGEALRLNKKVVELAQRLQNRNKELDRIEAELGAALGAALVMTEDRQAGLEQLDALLAQAKQTAKDQDSDLPPHWRMTQNLLAVKSKSQGGDGDRRTQNTLAAMDSPVPRMTQSALVVKSKSQRGDRR
jgi:DNA anti-recombination protein RmuC